MDPQILLQRLVAAANHAPIDSKDMFEYELCSFPTSLSEKPGLATSDKSSICGQHLANCKNQVHEASASKESTVYYYVINGGPLLHKVPWTREATFVLKHLVIHTIDTSNVDNNGYPTTTIVFNGYLQEPTAKEMARHSKGISGGAHSAWQPHHQGEGYLGE